jgi:predicted ATPase
MYISHLRIENYKSYEDSGPIHFGQGLNIVIGKNNSGKSALLEALKIQEMPRYEHVNEDIDLRVPRSQKIKITINMTQSEFRDAIGDYFIFPYPRSGKEIDVYEIFSREHIEILLTFESGMPALFDKTEPFARYQADENLYLNCVLSDITSGNFLIKEATCGPFMCPPFVQAIDFINSGFLFSPQRNASAVSPARGGEALSRDASNLAIKLNDIKNNRVRFDRLCDHMRELFPSVKDITIPIIQNNLQVHIWGADPATAREELSVSLDACGTGIGQALAILVVAIETKGGLIIIDEPNSFLHPGASKKLFQILSTLYDDNQYIVATHSSELISLAPPNQIVHVENDRMRSHAKTIDADDVEIIRHLLRDIGCNLSDILSADCVVWVEGPTKEACFPAILASQKRRMVRGAQFISVRSTGDFFRRRDSDLVFDIYEKLSRASPVIPRAVRFSFDREDRNATKCQEIITKTRETVHFLPATCYENYLLHDKAIHELLISNGSNATLAQISGRLNELIKISKRINDIPEKIHSTDGAKIIAAVFNEFAPSGSCFRKLVHSRQLTDWLLKNDPDHMSALTNYVLEICKDLVEAIDR